MVPARVDAAGDVYRQLSSVALAYRRTRAFRAGLKSEKAKELAFTQRNIPRRKLIASAPSLPAGRHPYLPSHSDGHVGGAGPGGGGASAGGSGLPPIAPPT